MSKEMKSKIIIIDDDSGCIDAFRRIFSSVDREVEYFQCPDEAISVFSKDPFSYSIAFIDHLYRYGDETKKLGEKLAKQFKELNPSITACIISGDETPESLQSWLSVPVDNYIYKPLRKAEALAFTEHYTIHYESNFLPVEDFKNSHEIMEKMGIIGESESILECGQSALRFSKRDLNVLLLGETGTGKELFAHGIHKNSPVRHLGFFPINCSTYKENSQLLEVELFGSEKGAFTGAEKKAGIFEVVNGGTVFLDEIHHLNPGAQAKLLRVLQEKKIRRVGGKTEYSVKFRLIAAGKPDLENLCKEGKFATDLYYRLKGLDLVIPSLRDRKRDIRPLTEFFLKKIKEQTGQSKKVSLRSIQHLQKYDWPGNVRELQQLIEKLNVMVDEDVISPKHLLKEISCKPSLNKNSMSISDIENESRQKKIALVCWALNESNFNFTEATRKLGLGEKRSTLRALINQLKIKDLVSQKKKTGILSLLTANLRRST